MKEQVEIWKDVVGFEGQYKVSSLGRVESLTRMVNRPISGMLPVKGRVLKPFLSKKTGYFNVSLGGKWYRNHRLLAIAFIPNPLNKAEVNHINGIKTDNRLENLEWNTKSENTIHSFKYLKRKPLKTYRGADHVLARSVIATFKNGDTKIYGAIQEAARDLKLSAGNICTTLKQVHNHTRGIDFKYYE